MSHTEQNDIAYSRPLVGRAGARERLRRRQRVVSVVWQGARLLLVSWGLLCLYCALKGCLVSRGIDFSAVGLHLLMGVTAWWLACRASTPPELGDRRRDS